ncbi:hypothetical protein [Saccharomonospora saliphila]|uniref:hypothetical protein n=1 Tax=Saccharomonospora saliphila TaxID=369829 RepID=UPI0003A76EEA|nr:hypothetical protein [Saccharomonospora saliphila]
MGSTLPEPGEAVAVARLRRGTVGESKRVSHVVPLPTVEPASGELSAFCGASLRPGEAEWLPSLRGMPCERCLSVLLTRVPAETLDAAS